jgi:hypothetical protein
MSSPLKHEIHAFLDELVNTYGYRPLPKKMSVAAREFYENNLNGFDVKRPATINNTLICSDYERVVIGDYGAYLEFTEHQRLVDFSIKKGQEWRFDELYIRERNLNPKYLWLDYHGVKVYYQLGPVKYADYKADHYYICVHEFDEGNHE